MLDRYCVNESYTIKEVLEQFENNNDRVAIVLSEGKKVIGVISQGDILRALSAGSDIYMPIVALVKNSFLHLYEKDLEKAYEMFRKKKITLLPIVNTNNELIDVVTLDDIFDYLYMRK